MKGKVYEETLRALQIELVKAQYWIKKTGQRVVIVFEGRDAAGKGGTIKRFLEHLNPRGARHVALTKPNETESGQWYFQRYVAHMPTAGEIVCFDRSWYNRAGVERVMGFCSVDELALFLRQAPDFEQALAESGIVLFKLWLSIGKAEQQRRLAARKEDPLKAWKLSPIDAAAQEKWDDYTRARDAMFAMTDTPWAPWTVVNTNDKRTGRIDAIRFVLAGLEYEGKAADVVGEPDPRIVGPARTMLPPLDI
ncbi:MAG: polyphosphate kinase 2 [Acidimicrobiia bacterium]|nr:polyphosphate kinase 2 [Acidimicrobiia bacterium]